MAFGKNIRTWFEGKWHEGDIAVMRAADHGIWQGSSVFDGARLFDGLVPDLEPHCARTNASADALMIEPTIETGKMVEIAREGLKAYAKGAAVYIRPMYWAINGSDLGVAPARGATGFALCLEEVAMPDPSKATTLTTTQFRRPVMADNVTNAKAGCLYPNNARMLVEAQRKGFGNALVQDAMGNVAETATANVWMVKDGEYFTPVANGTFLAGLTRKRVMGLLRDAGEVVNEAVLTLDDFRSADEVFLTGNFAKITPVSAFDDVGYQPGKGTQRAREAYMDWALGSPL
ncbi:MAG: branched-chain amino acid aminotransferase [Rhodobacteraceae bacterium]|uniref:Probable branched-chain-amino-acid aminotransferase n=1 Tax=Thioclava marina TaxID=1915077 RepID=A0ABX3MPS4_9RHOB|nr:MULTISPECIES: branched-chain amino acid aminotransferase [Thioclava]TNE87356.1 MAG: branched-chain amino acid aminotransferase [Paracoccaceae bacterium]MBD3803880.1 branched-chain amino acid aminotransferase [Thioclava sp.]OOY13536.1 branched chain amino acid aminotransferase [Thioclava marina]OOY29251.1 branched chain amino acid aminotransferase [Thioclava sp. L04-15]TNF16179.1 MAG: branched-chain amino acid aminotransferase [Paracoccaceae bacterium]